jgi:hypothetical protein
MTGETITAREFAALERQTKRHILRRTLPGASNPLPWKFAEDGKQKLIFVSGLSDRAQERWLQLRMQPAPAACPAPAIGAPAQVGLMPEVDADRQRLAALGISGTKADRVLRIFCAIKPLFNHDYAALGFDSKAAYRESIAANLNLSLRHIERLEQAYKQREEIADLVKGTPGPKAGTVKALDLSARAHIKAEWLKGLAKAQVYRSYQQYIEAKASSPGCRASHAYKLASRGTVENYIESLGALADAAREGKDALKAACGHIDRSYLDLAPLERVESDEVKLNLLSYDPRHPVNRRGEPWIRRYWLLTFYDARSIFPLTWTLCEGSEYELRHGIAVEDEINLFVALVREFGVPRSIHSDRGRFRGKIWGGEPYQQHIDQKFAPVNGILQRVGQLAGFAEGIRHDMPRVHNPRGTRLERFHRWVADWFRGKPGWIGANTRERKMTRGDDEAERYKLWCVGKLAPGERSPLMTRDEKLTEVSRMMEAWRDHNSDGTDMHGMTPRAVFTQNSPASGFARISEEELAFATAQHFENEHIAQGGIIQLRDGSRYSHPQLAALKGQKREVVRLRHDHSFITVLPAQKGESTIIAPRRVRVGMNDPDELARQSEYQARLQKLAGVIVKSMEYDPGAQFAEQPKAETAAAPPAPETEISGVEFVMEDARYKSRVKPPLDFPDLEY